MALIFSSNVHKLQELLEYMPGPDFPTGGLIMGNAGYEKFLYFLYVFITSYVRLDYGIYLSLLLPKNLGGI